MLIRVEGKGLVVSIFMVWLLLQLIRVIVQLLVLMIHMSVMVLFVYVGDGVSRMCRLSRLG